MHIRTQHGGFAGLRGVKSFFESGDIKPWHASGSLGILLAGRALDSDDYPRYK
jgi:hypothetical protein